MPCPLNGPRNIQEFVCGGEVKTQPDPKLANNQDWTDYLFMLRNKADVVREWWYHVPTSFWFIAERNTVSDDIVRTYRVESIRSNDATSDDSNCK